MTEHEPGTGADGNPDDSTDERSEEGTEPTVAAPRSNYKVLGEKDAPDGVGVLGTNAAASGPAHGVEGVVDSPDEGATGVHGVATTPAGSGATYGVRGVTESDALAERSVHPAGVHGRATGGDRPFGVRGDVTSKTGTGVYAEAAPESHQRRWNADWSTGITAVTRYSDADPDLRGASAVEAIANPGSGGGLTHAVLAQHFSDEGYAVYAYGDTRTRETHEVGGHLEVANVGAAAYRSANQTVPDDDRTTVAFDAADTDHFGGFDTGTGVYTVQEDGDYHVDALIDWDSTFDSGDTISHYLEVNGDDAAGLAVEMTVPIGTAPSKGFSKTLFGLTAGDTIEVAVYQLSGSSKDIYGASGREETYLTVTKVG